MLTRFHPVFFTDTNNGIVRLHDKRVLITADGGQSWRRATGAAEATIKFADPQVGWSCSEQTVPGCSYTVDGGKSWTSRDINFPTDIYSYSIPRRDRIYVVGDHGMIYRYRVVPADYTAKGMLDAPLMSAYGGAIVTQLQQMQTQVAALQTRLSAAGASVASTPGAAAGAASVPSGTNATAVGGFSQDASATGFTQNASTQPAQDASAAGSFTQDPNAAAGGFAQDASAATSSQFVQNCCANQVQGLQTSFGALAQEVPNFSSQFRNLNLSYVGM